MKIEYWKVDPTGNITLIVETPGARESQSRVAAELLKRDRHAEQVGFLEKPEDPRAQLRLQMMGGEFCGNATISTAAIICGGETKKLALEVSGAPGVVAVSIAPSPDGGCVGTVAMPLPDSVCATELCCAGSSYFVPIVRFPGICHGIVRGEIPREDALLHISDWCAQLDTDALGLMFYDEAAGSLKPLVYVASTDTAVWESSCASGTAAVAAYLACTQGRDTAIALLEPCGVLSAEAKFSEGKVNSLTLTGKAHIVGKYVVEISP